MVNLLFNNVIHTFSKIIPFFLVFFIVYSSCKVKDANPSGMPEEVKTDEFDYAFFAAGHTYGNALHFQYGLHPPFVSTIPYINSYPKMRLGVLTGDVVPKPKPDYWDSAQVDIDKFTIPIHIAPGNHDRGPEFISRYKKKYYAFKEESDLFIILSPDNWNIVRDQKTFLDSAIQANNDPNNRIFIFCHELIWWAPDNKFRNVDINYRPHYPGSTNYLTDVKPVLDTLQNEVVIIAGDLGTVSWVSSYMYYKEGNITLIGSGMGGGVEDNILVVEVNRSGSLNYRLLGINSTPPSELIDLESYVLP